MIPSVRRCASGPVVDRDGIDELVAPLIARPEQVLDVVFVDRSAELGFDRQDDAVALHHEVSLVASFGGAQVVHVGVDRLGVCTGQTLLIAHSLGSRLHTQAILPSRSHTLVPQLPVVA